MNFEKIYGIQYKSLLSLDYIKNTKIIATVYFL